MIDDKTKFQAYWEGHNAETARIAAKDRARSVLDAHPNLQDIAAEVAKQLGRDSARKQQILQRSPGLAWSMDAAELLNMSSRELATRELKELGITPGDNDPEALLSAHHAGRQWARGMKGGEAAASRLIGGSAHDAAGGSFMDRYLNSED